VLESYGKSKIDFELASADVTTTLRCLGISDEPCEPS
jgi:hypothetical protein